MRLPLILSCLVFGFAVMSHASVKEIAYDGKEVYVHVLKDHSTIIIFPEPITQVIRGFGSDTYVVQRNDNDPKVLELMPTDTEVAEMTITGLSGEEYSLRFVANKDFYTKLTILRMVQGVNGSDSDSVPPQSVKTTKEDVIVVEDKKAVMEEPKQVPNNSLVTFIPGPQVPVVSAAAGSAPGANVDQPSPDSKLPKELSVRITLKGNNLPLKIYFSTISQVTGYNIITTPEIDSQKTSINLENIEVWRALKSLLYKFGYGFKVSQEDLIITESETRIFNVTMPAVDQNFTDETSNESYSDSNSSNGTTSSSSGNQQSQDVKVGTKIYYENKSPQLSLWTDLENNVKSMVTPNTGSYSISKSSGSIIVTDKPQVLDKIGDLVSTINETLSRQQSFEIQIIEVTLSSDYETGIDWNAVAKGVAGLNNITAATNFSAAGFASGQLFTVSATGPNSNSGSNGFGGVSAVVKALDSMGSVNVISKPSITVSNMFPCVLQEVTSIPYISGTGQTSNTSTTTTDVVTSEVSTGLTMRLEAKIEDDKTVLNISAAENTLDSMNSVPVGGGLTIQEPQVSTKSITTNVTVETGKSLILGGLISSNKQITTQGIPGLDKMPFLGGAFKYSGKTIQKTELVIIITPKKIIKNL